MSDRDGVGAEGGEEVKRVTWAEKQTGDIFLAAVPGFGHQAIWDAERAMHPGAPQDFQATHAGVIGFRMPSTAMGVLQQDMHLTVVEAWLDRHRDSVASIIDATKYDAAAAAGYVEVWRPDAFDPMALQKYIAKYGPEKYGFLNLLGFEWVALVKEMTGRDITNPIDCSQVCSQGMGDFLTINYGYTLAEEWIMAVPIPNLDPLALRLDFLMSAK